MNEFRIIIKWCSQFYAIFLSITNYFPFTLLFQNGKGFKIFPFQKNFSKINHLLLERTAGGGGVSARKWNGFLNENNEKEEAGKGRRDTTQLLSHKTELILFQIFIKSK